MWARSRQAGIEAAQREFEARDPDSSALLSA